MLAPSVPRLRNRRKAARTIRSRVCCLCAAGYRMVLLKDYMHHLIAPVKETSRHFESSIEFSRGLEWNWRLAFQQHYASLSHEFSLPPSASPENNTCHLFTTDNSRSGIRGAPNPQRFGPEPDYFQICRLECTKNGPCLDLKWRGGGAPQPGHPPAGPAAPPAINTVPVNSTRIQDTDASAIHQY